MQDAYQSSPLRFRGKKIFATDWDRFLNQWIQSRCWFIVSCETCRVRNHNQHRPPRSTTQSLRTDFSRFRKQILQKLESIARTRPVFHNKPGSKLFHRFVRKNLKHKKSFYRSITVNPHSHRVTTQLSDEMLWVIVATNSQTCVEGIPCGRNDISNELIDSGQCFFFYFFKNLNILPSFFFAPFGRDVWLKNDVLYNILVVFLYFSPPQAIFFSVFARKLHFFNEIWLHFKFFAYFVRSA